MSYITYYSCSTNSLIDSTISGILFSRILNKINLQNIQTNDDTYDLR